MVEFGASWCVLKPLAHRDLIKENAAFRSALLHWFAQHGKDYPWRRTRDPYAILVSEVMLQQTRLAVVLGKGYYDRFMQTFPDLVALAQADEEKLLRTWEGLGYYRRARMLQATARAVLDRHNGRFPESERELLALPGVGRYTLGALRSFAFDLPTALVDGNVMRVFARLFDDKTPIDSPVGIRMAWERAEFLLDNDHPRLFNSALMELGQSICRVGSPDCWQCPLAEFCRSREPELLPIKAKRTELTSIDEHAIWVENEEGAILLQQEQGSRRKGMWRLPLRQADEVSAEDLLLQVSYGITRYRVTLRIYRPRQWQAHDNDQWISAEMLEQLPMATPHRKVMRQLGERLA
ncbi:MAG: A/G-specific adenine glycosylase [Verrucomicrobia bacterium]|nr:MAG: A/G-specific adenine glycosylase [Verrucomicrobiota bacterium]